MSTKPIPEFAFRLWAQGAGDEHAADDEQYPALSRALWRVRGFILRHLFGWWWWE